MKNINEFKKGDVVTRIAPAKPYKQPYRDILTGEWITPTGDRSYMGEKLTFIGIANGCAYFERNDPFSKAIFGDKLLSLRLDVFSDDWDIWVDPKSLYNTVSKTINAVSKKYYEKELQKALEKEDYEKAEELKNKLKD